MNMTNNRREIEELASKFHDIYNKELTKQGRENKWPDDYNALPDEIKDLDRALAKYALTTQTKYAEEKVKEVVKKIKKEVPTIELLPDRKFLRYPFIITWNDALEKLNKYLDFLLNKHKEGE